MNDIAYEEWMAWRKMCTKLYDLGIDVNKEDDLTKLIKEWGERYADWRNEQANLLATQKDATGPSDEVIAEALADLKAEMESPEFSDTFQRMVDIGDKFIEENKKHKPNKE